MQKGRAGQGCARRGQPRCAHHLHRRGAGKGRGKSRAAFHRPVRQVSAGDDPRDRLLPRHRELRTPSHRPPSRRAAADAARLPARRRDRDRRRESPDDSAGPRDVGRRSLAEGHARRIRFPPALRHRARATKTRTARSPSTMASGTTSSVSGTARWASASAMWTACWIPPSTSLRTSAR